MSILARSTLAAARTVRAAPRQVRAAHFENVVDHTLPTSVNKYSLAAKMVVFTIAGFGTPFLGAWWQLVGKK
ncbi:cytochrome c oxidase subunit 7c [Cryptococcus wingfieldii CBS 7118]|uniref:Cytochrome c oxidase subunit 8, mitochondrial n=1 Tax=Cryptococcus wingfieldii CBS 7118 TaxID=1295528 RepID=A0A1E3IZU1_9TREE|nr:cytochrome c oxidase subunit 7c [Cryptococcus wingfieldii CBS 7118]ODN93426.1 cytochrome c oxidase subunit 7c [Cryptococcus wingfieldii CBS 7118]